MCSSINNTWIKWSSGNRKKQNKTTTTKTNKQKKSTQSNTYVHMQNIYVLWMPLGFSYIRRPSPCVKLDHSVWRHTTQAIKKGPTVHIQTNRCFIFHSYYPSNLHFQIHLLSCMTNAVLVRHENSTNQTNPSSKYFLIVLYCKLLPKLSLRADPWMDRKKMVVWV